MNTQLNSKHKTTIHSLFKKKEEKEKITFLTAYDYPTAVAEENAGIDVILVGDSLGMCVYGFDSTLPVTMDIMINHCKAVKKGAPNCFVIGDMPYMSYQVSLEQAVANAGRLMQESGIDCVKLEGGVEVADRIKAITNAGIAVMGHLGLTPQSTAALGGYKAQGKQAESAMQLIEASKTLEEAGCVSIILEAIPFEVAKIITNNSSIPIFGIGAGPHCDGQALVVNDLLGYYGDNVPKFVKKYASINHYIETAVTKYIEEVKNGIFPAPEHCYKINKAEMEKIKEKLR